jgi:hypothetical protein
MATFAVMGGNFVTNVIVADTLEEASVLGQCIEYTKDNPAGIGMVYDEATGTFSLPVVEEPNA